MTPLRVLVIENDAVFAEYARFLLEESAGVGKFAVHLAYTLIQAMTELATDAFDVCLLDLNLNGGGTSTLKDILSIGYEVPIIVMTGDGSEETEIACMNLGAQDFIRKTDMAKQSMLPVFVEKLIHANLRYCAIKGVEREWAPHRAAVEELKPACLEDRESELADDTELEKP